MMIGGNDQLASAEIVGASRWRIELLGWLRASSGDILVSRFPTRHVATLLAYLSLHHRRSHPREELAEMLWPDSEADASRLRLNQTVASLRRQIEPPGFEKGSVLVSDRFAIRLNPEAVTTDCARFLELAAPSPRTNVGSRIGQLREALEIYRGELLPGFYHAWISEDRTRLADAYATTLNEVLVLAEESGDLNLAVDAANRLVAMDPLEERNHQRLMALYHRRGQRGQAIRQFEELERILRTELAEMPSAQTQELLKNIRLGKLGTAPNIGAPKTRLRVKSPESNDLGVGPTVHLPPKSTRFYGRETELGAAISLLENGSSRLVNLLGAGGCGKSRLSIEVARKLGAGFDE